MRAFLADHIPSVGHMEALVLAHDAPGQDWSVEDVAGRLYVPVATAEGILRDLARSGLLAEDAATKRYRYAPDPDGLARRAADARDVYRRCLILVTQLIHERTETPAWRFSDAFRFRRGE
ncbi:MAG: hypothetical protein ACOZNI_02715 [Myxococcota bacterium]